MSALKQPAPAAIVIFGANGDLTSRLIVPALYNLAGSNLLPERFAVVGVDHSTKGLDAWRDGLREVLVRSLRDGGGAFDDGQWDRIARAMSYVSGDFTESVTYRRLASHLAERNGKDGLGGNVLFYLAVPDRFFGPIVDELGGAGLTSESAGGYRRVIVEKPFGHDLESARALNARILQRLREEQIFRIDHYLGKETVQNILALRFANGLFEPIWNRDRIDHVQV
ncbi:MAG TPA: hypothetical protein VMU08_02345, partial [Rhizomicrobium sp.]|nr:hypothetical protein [Rhizomicrobium sp.]